MPFSISGTQDGDADAYVEVPLLFSIQDEGLSALRPANLAAKAAQGLALNTTTDDFVVRAPLSLHPRHLCGAPGRPSLPRGSVHVARSECHEAMPCNADRCGAKA